MSRWRRGRERDGDGTDAHLEYLRSIPHLESAWTLTRGASWWATWQHLFAAKDWATMRRFQSERAAAGLSAVPRGPLEEVPLTIDEAHTLLEQSARVAASRVVPDDGVRQFGGYRRRAQREHP